MLKCAGSGLRKIALTLRAHFGLLGLFHSTPEKTENVALFQWSGLTSTLIRHENGTFPSKTLFKQRNLKTPGFRFSAEVKQFENEGFQKTIASR